MGPSENAMMLPTEKHARKHCFQESVKNRRHLLLRKVVSYGPSKNHKLSTMRDDAHDHRVKSLHLEETFYGNREASAE